MFSAALEVPVRHVPAGAVVGNAAHPATDRDDFPFCLPHPIEARTGEQVRRDAVDDEHFGPCAAVLAASRLLRLHRSRVGDQQVERAVDALAERTDRIEIRQLQRLDADAEGVELRAAFADGRNYPPAFSGILAGEFEADAARDRR